MTSEKPPASETRLVVDLSSTGVARLALVERAGSSLGAISACSDAEFTTMTAVFQKFERDLGISLTSCRVAIAIAGVATGVAIPIARSRWTLSREGLDQYFGRRVIIVNEVAAKAWSVFGAVSAEWRPISGGTPPSLADSGRWAFVSLADGLGIAIIDTTGSGPRVLETEAGHVGMAAFDACGDSLIAELRQRNRFASWENALKFALSGECAVLPEHAAQRCLGAMTADLVYGFGAWGGVILSDKAAQLVGSPAERAAFLTPSKIKRPYDRMLAQAPFWGFTARDAALRGCAKMLAHD